MMQTIEAIKSEHGTEQVSLLSAAGISESSYKRWKRRVRSGVAPVEKPGAKKVAPIDLGKLKQQITDLDHGKKRSAGTGRLYLANSHRVSRREFNVMVKQARAAANRKKAAGRCTVRWLRPDLTWALDGLQYGACHVQNLADLCSRYKFAPMTTGYMPCGEEIAGHLERHFTRFGPPLFIKRDNGANLNHRAVNDLLADLMVIPINSPCYTASYNGAIEHSQAEIKGWLKKWKAASKTTRELTLAVENAAHALNHHPRRCLAGKNACRSYFGVSRLRYNKRKRRQVYDWIRDLAVDLSARCGNNKIDPAAWRIAARKWMEKHRLIVITKPVKVLPHFF
jgi:hypothetical protein